MKTYAVMPHYIVTDELRELATNALKSFRESSPETVLISVDDGSPMDTTFLKELSDVYIRNEKNSGFAITCNNGFRWIFEHEQDDCYIICANNDIEVNRKVVPELIRPFEMFDNVAITGILSFCAKEVDGKPLEQFCYRRMAEGGLLNGYMQDGGLWCSKKSTLQSLAEYIYMD